MEAPILHITNQMNGVATVLMLIGQGALYDWLTPTLCSITLKTTKYVEYLDFCQLDGRQLIRIKTERVRVNYGSIVDVVEELEASPVLRGLDKPTYDALNNLNNQISRQDIVTNLFGDRIESIYSSRMESLGSDEEKRATLNMVLVCSKHPSA